ncbi:unnamed protein product [marine sediment metagenome]|uniref:Uncharacterized protein n=1 Tax=marine sediment metagenome TaxID=412755 RepID=X1LRG6_9ZZZZ
MVKKQRKPRKGFTRSQKEWEETIAAHIGKFIDKLTVTDVMNVAVFCSSSYVAYTTIKHMARAEYPTWFEALKLVSPAAFIWGNLMQISSVGAELMTEEQKIASALMIGYGTLKLPSVVVSTAPAIAKAVAT